ncbi:hyalin-like [Antedon mediterranea]|uniref:hyalin-like n=1 Tax=Antedon mediterranea TaxID=105859 RepID=UPI003AF6B596
MFAPVYIIVSSMTFLHFSKSQKNSCYNTFELVSEFKEAKQISTHSSNAVAAWAVDSGTDGIFAKHTCSHTHLGPNNPWWYVNLGTETVISKIIIYNRIDCCATRLAGAVVRIGNSNASPFSENSPCGERILRTDALTKNPIEMSCNPPVSGQYVTISLPGSQPLTLCEVKVYKDIGNPEVVCPDDITVSAGIKQSINPVTWNPPEVSDNFHTDLSATCSPSSGSLFPVGFTKVTCSASDATGNEGNCSFVVNIADDKEPDLVCPKHITVKNNTDQYQDPVTWNDITASDLVGGSGEVWLHDISSTCTPESGSIFDVGSTIVTCSARDATGNVGSCSFVVHVIGQTFESNDVRSVLTCPEHISVDSDQSRTITWSDLTLTSMSATCTPPSGSVFDDGSTIVTCSANDVNGDIIKCSFVVHLKARSSSDFSIGIVCPRDITFNTEQPVVVWNNPELTDNVGTDVQPTCNPPSGSTFLVGSTRVTCYAVYSIVNISCWFNVGSLINATQLPGYSHSDNESKDTHHYFVIGIGCVMVVLIASVIIVVIRYYNAKRKQITFEINMKAQEETVTWDIIK